MDKICSNCIVEKVGKNDTPDKPLKACSQCKYVHFCGQECQKQFWNIHQAECAYFKKDLKYLPQPARLLMQALNMKLNQKNKKFGDNLKKFNE